MRYVEKIIDGTATSYSSAYSYSTTYPWSNTAKAFDWNKNVAPNEEGIDGSSDWWNTYATVKLGTSTSSNRWYVNGLTNWKSAVNENFDMDYSGTGTEYTNFSCLPTDSVIKSIRFLVRSSMPSYANEYATFYRNSTQIGSNVSTGSFANFTLKSTTSSGTKVDTTGWTWNRESDGNLKATGSSGSTYSIGAWTVANLQAGQFKPKVELRRTSGASSNYWYPRGFALKVVVDIPMYTIRDISINGSISGVGEYFSGKKVILTANPNPGYRFKYWGDGSTSTTREVTVTSDTSYVAYFEPMYVLYDTILNYKKWKENLQSGIGLEDAKISNITDIGFTITSNSNVNEGKIPSVLFPVEAGKSYKIDVDIIGNGWDIYIFFYDSNTTSGTGIDFADNATRRFSDNFNREAIFTAPQGATQAVIRTDANGANNSITFNNFRIYPADKQYMSNSLLATERYNHGSWNMPTPNRPGYSFKSWNTSPDGTGLTVNSSDPYPLTDLILYSQWEPNALFIGNKSIKEIYIGNKPIKEVYIGNQKIYG